MNAHRAVLDGARRLARAPDWTSFTCSKAEAVVWAACVCSADASQQRAAELLAALAPALARGMQLLSEQQLAVHTLEQHEAGMVALIALWEVWLAYTRALALSPDPETARALVQLAVQMTRAGTITAFTQLARTLARFLSSPEAQPQQQTGAAAAEAAPAAQQLRAISTLATALLCVFGDVVRIWPGGVQALSNPAMAAAADADAELAVAAMRNKNAHQLTTAPTSSSSSGPSSSCSGSSTANKAAGLAFKLCELPGHIAGGSSSLMLLQMCCLALTAQALHQQQHGLSPVAAGGCEPAAAAGSSEQQPQQGLAVPYHLQLQQALGLPEGLELDAAELELTTEHLLLGALSGLRCVRFQDRHSSSSSSSGGSSSRGTGLQQQQQQPGAAVDAALLAPLLLVLLECCLMQPQPGIVRGCLAAMVQLLDGCTELDCIPESLAGDLPAAMLRLLVPVIRRLDAAAAAAAPAAAAAAGSDTIAASAGLVLLALSACVAQPAFRRDAQGWTDDRRVRAMTAGFLQQPQHFAALVEAAVRGKQFNAAPLISGVALLLMPAADASMVLSAAAQQQVFSLLISCLKAGAAAAANEAAAALFPAADTGLTLSANAAMRASPLLVPGNSSSSSNNSSKAAANGSSGPALAAHLLGRALVSTGRGLQHLASSGSSDRACRQEEAKKTLILANISMTMQLFADLLQLTPALPGPVLQQLLDQQAALQQQVALLRVQQLPEVAAAASLAEQLEAAGAAVVAQVPVKHCCNHHGCTNISWDSELELASGASCVCSGCLAARYCSRECQVAHYKHWHKAVCRRLQQQPQQQQQQQS